ncbi:MAG: HTTM domain-containing protein [Acidimicrobiales bacterium]
MTAALAQRLAVVRVAVFAYAAVYVAVRSPTIVDTSELDPARFDPIGGVAWLNTPLQSPVLAALVALAVLASGAAAAGWHYRICSPAAALAVLVVLSHRLSWGQVLHTENLVVLHACILAFTPAADAWSLDARSTTRRPRASDESDYTWALWLISAVTVSTYVIAAWAKLRIGGADWISGDVLRSHIAHDNLRKHLLGDPSSPLARFVVPQAWLFSPMAIGALALELAAPMALLGFRRVRHAWVVMAWLFHVAVLALMAIVFPYQLLGIAFLSFVDAEAIGQRLGRLRPISRRSSADLRR